MKKILLACLLCVGLLGCEDNYRHISLNNDSTFELNGKKCELVVLHPQNGGRLYYVDCSTGSSLNYQSGKNSTTTVVTTAPVPTTEPTSCPMPPRKCDCQ